MSMELYVFSDRRLGSIAEWQHAIDAEGFALKLSTEGSFETLTGFLPMTLGSEETGCECDHFDAAELLAELKEEELEYGREWKQALAFRWGGDMNECLAAYMAATAYARATEGGVFDCEEGKMLTPDEAAQAVRSIQEWRASRQESDAT